MDHLNICLLGKPYVYLRNKCCFCYCTKSTYAIFFCVILPDSKNLTCLLEFDHLASEVKAGNRNTNSYVIQDVIQTQKSFLSSSRTVTVPQEK